MISGVQSKRIKHKLHEKEKVYTTVLSNYKRTDTTKESTQKILELSKLRGTSL